MHPATSGLAILADLGRINTERLASTDNIKQSSGSNMSRSGSDSCNSYDTVPYARWHHRERRRKQLAWSCQGQGIHARNHWWQGAGSQ